MVPQESLPLPLFLSNSTYCLAPSRVNCCFFNKRSLTSSLSLPFPLVLLPSVVLYVNYIEPTSFQTPKETDFHLSSKAYLDGFEIVDDDEGLLNVSSILSTFIILFLVSLFYGATVTVIKVKGTGWEGAERIFLRHSFTNYVPIVIHLQEGGK